MGRKRKLHLGTVPIGGAPVKSRRLARSITSQYHVIQNERNLVLTDTTMPDSEKSKKLADLEQKMEEIGGTNRYQQASIVNTQHFKTSKWVAGTLTKLGLQPKAPAKLNVLEVGAINTQLQQYNWMNIRAIDLNSQHPLIEECDFFTVEPEGKYDVVVCSMVLNCVDEPIKRGEMLIRLSCQLVPEKGILFFVLPKRCIDSQFVGGNEWFASLLNGLGLWELQPCRETPKLYFYVLGNRPPAGGDEGGPGSGKGSVRSKDGSGGSGSIGSGSGGGSGGGSKGSGHGGADSTCCSAPKPIIAGSTDWKARARATIARHMSAATKGHFTRDFSAVPAHKFAIALPADCL